MQEAVKEVIERLQAGNEVKFVRRMLGGAVEVEIWVPYWTKDFIKVLVLRFVDGKKQGEREQVVQWWRIQDMLTAGWQVS